MKNSITEGKERIAAKEADEHGVLTPRASTALEDLKAEIQANLLFPRDDRLVQSIRERQDASFADMSASTAREWAKLDANDVAQIQTSSRRDEARQIITENFDESAYKSEFERVEQSARGLATRHDGAADSERGAGKERSTVQTRAELREAAVNEMRLAGVEKPAIDLDKAVVKAWVDADTLEFSRARSDAKRESIMDGIAGNLRHSPEYAKEMGSRSKTIADAASRVNEVVDLEEGKRAREVAALRSAEIDAASRSARMSALDAQSAAAVAMKRQHESATAAQDLKLGEREQRAPAIDLAKEQERALGKAADAPAQRAGADGAEATRLQSRSETHWVYSTAYVEMERRAEAMRAMSKTPEAKREDHPSGVTWAREDFKALTAVRADEKTIALDAIGRSIEANQAYAATVRREAPELVAAVTRNKTERDGEARDVSGVAEEERRRAIKRPVQEEELSLSLRTRFVVSTERDGLLDKGRTEFTFRGGSRDGAVAFQDVGKQLNTVAEDREVVRSMVEVAATKGWKEITVNGTDEFKRAAWLEAKLAGMEVNGYEPREADKKRLTELQADRGQMNSIATSDREPSRKVGGDDGEKLRDWIVQEMQSKPVLSVVERTKMDEAVAKGDQAAQAEIRKDATTRSEFDVEAVRRMSKKDLDQVAQMYNGAPSAETERRVRALLDGARRHEPAHDVRPEKQQPKGLQVDGDSLTVKEQTTLAAMKEYLGKQGKYSPEFIGAALSDVENRMRSQRVHIGEVVQHGVDHYKNDQKKDLSYFVTLKTATGLETVWGKQIGEALQKGDVKVGDQIVLANVGKTPVSVLEQGIGENGRAMKQWKDTNKNDWTAQPIDRLTSKELDNLQGKANRGEPTLQVYDSKAERARVDRPADRDQGREHQTRKRDMER